MAQQIHLPGLSRPDPRPGETHFGNMCVAKGGDGKDEWLTPPGILAALGPFDLDPCAPVVRPWPMAQQHYTVTDGGLELPWHGRVWCNPPYADAAPWLAKLRDHGNGIALVFARTETTMFVENVWPAASGILFIAGRLSFYHITGAKAANCAGAPSVLIAYGRNNFTALKRSGLAGKLLRIN